MLRMLGAPTSRLEGNARVLDRVEGRLLLHLQEVQWYSLPNLTEDNDEHFMPTRTEVNAFFTYANWCCYCCIIIPRLWSFGVVLDWMRPPAHGKVGLVLKITLRTGQVVPSANDSLDKWSQICDMRNSRWVDGTVLNFSPLRVFSPFLGGNCERLILSRLSFSVEGFRDLC